MILYDINKINFKKQNSLVGMKSLYFLPFYILGSVEFKINAVTLHLVTCKKEKYFSAGILQSMG